jgi:predicted CXXCH cytochrome family protein
MKKAIVAIALAGFTSAAHAAIAAGSHDLSATGPNPLYRGALSSCQYCHAPHNVNTAVTGAPLWNRHAPQGAAFTMYTSNTINQAPAATPNTNSATCLSCHDGFSAVGDMFTGTDVAFPAISGYANVGKNLGDDHPVSMRFVEVVNEIDSVANVTAAGLVLYSDGAGNQTLECGSCHDPHGTSNGATGGPSFLRVSAATICAECHLK